MPAPAIGSLKSSQPARAPAERQRRYSALMRNNGFRVSLGMGMGGQAGAAGAASIKDGDKSPVSQYSVFAQDGALSRSSAVNSGVLNPLSHTVITTAAETYAALQIQSLVRWKLFLRQDEYHRSHWTRHDGEQALTGGLFGDAVLEALREAKSSNTTIAIAMQAMMRD